MGLPFVLDVAIGLMFIFLTLSLLASELQELIATLLQWRAKHLRDAIEVFLAGGVNTRSTEVQQLVAQLYDDPLLKNINQEAKGVLTKLARQFSRVLPGNQAGAFGKSRSTGPSYIPPETFATSLLERLGLATLTQKLTEVRLEKFSDRILSQVRTYAESANIQDLASGETDNGRNFKILVDEYEQILGNFSQEEVTLTTCVERMGESLAAYITSYPVSEPASENEPVLDPKPGAVIAQNQEISYFAKRLRSLKLSMFGEKNERAIRSGGLRPSLTEIAELTNRSSNAYKEVEEAYYAIKNRGTEIEARINPELEKQLRDEYPDTIEKQLIDRDIKSAWDQVSPGRDIKTIERQLKKDYPSIFKRVKPRLDKNSQKLYKAQRSYSYRRQRSGIKAMESWLGKLWQRLTQSDLAGLERQRQGLISSIFDQLDDGDQKRFVGNILDTLSPEDQAEIMDGALAALDNENRHLMVNQVLDRMASSLDESGNLPLLTEEERSIYDHYQTYKSIQKVLSSLPNSVQESFSILARRAQTRVQQTGNDISQFREEVGLWFDRAMSRSSGVYKRNAKGVALLIGLTLATFTNSDTFYMIDRLSSDENLRRVVTEQAIQLKPSPVSSATAKSGAVSPISDRQQLKNIKTITDSALQEISLPLGWNPINVTQQLGCRAPSVDRDPTQWETLFRSCLPESKEVSSNLYSNADQISKTHWNSIPRILLGWLVSGIAISMGAPFWFDLLGKIVNVRNSGAKPASPAAEQPTSNNLG